MSNMNDPNSPYYLTSADHQGNIISPVILNGENYANYVRIMTNALKQKHKYCFVNGSFTKLASNSPEFRAWEKNNSMVLAQLYNTINKMLHGSVTYAENASEIQIDLKEHYLQSNEIRTHQLTQEITLTKQGNLTVSEYFTKLKELWDELDAHLQLPTRTCTKEYNFSKHQEVEKVHPFLMGLFYTVWSGVVEHTCN